MTSSFACSSRFCVEVMILLAGLAGVSGMSPAFTEASVILRHATGNEAQSVSSKGSRCAGLNIGGLRQVGPVRMNAAGRSRTGKDMRDAVLCERQMTDKKVKEVVEQEENVDLDSVLQHMHITGSLQALEKVDMIRGMTELESKKDAAHDKKNVVGHTILNLKETAHTLALESSHVLMPHPLKAFRGGEDVQIQCTAGGHTLVGVFDGVGGWADLGVDPAMYPKEMARLIEENLKANPEVCLSDEKPLVTLLQKAYEDLHAVEVPGSCTVCLALMTSNGQLHVLNVGDSGLHVIREGMSVFATEDKQHRFNCPYQLGMGSDDSPQDADYYVLEDIADGDVVVMATDGVWDNVYQKDMLQIVDKYQGDPTHVSKALGELAHVNGADTKYMSPFAANAARKGFNFLGGKMDDVTVVTSRVRNAASLKGLRTKPLVRRDEEDYCSPVSSIDSAEFSA